MPQKMRELFLELHVMNRLNQLNHPFVPQTSPEVQHSLLISVANQSHVFYSAVDTSGCRSLSSSEWLLSFLLRGHKNPTSGEQKGGRKGEGDTEIGENAGGGGQ
eukprot:1077239-Rhodomonas_salina.3